jgi:hypothetical protein
VVCACTCVCVWILWCGSGEWSAPEQLISVICVRGLLPRGFEGVELAAEVGELGAEVADALKGFFLFGCVELLLGEGVVLVDGAGEGG